MVSMFIHVLRSFLADILVVRCLTLLFPCSKTQCKLCVGRIKLVRNKKQIMVGPTS